MTYSPRRYGPGPGPVTPGSCYCHNPDHYRFARQRTGQAPTPLRMPRGWGYDIRDAAILIAVLYGILLVLGVV